MIVVNTCRDIYSFKGLASNQWKELMSCVPFSVIPWFLFLPSLPSAPAPVWLCSRLDITRFWLKKKPHQIFSEPQVFNKNPKYVPGCVHPRVVSSFFIPPVMPTGGKGRTTEEWGCSHPISSPLT